MSIVLAAFAIMLIGFVASLVMLADQDRLRQLLSAHAETHLGRELQIDGAVSLQFFPRLRIQAGQVRLSGSEALDGLDLLSSDELSAEIRLWPLIVGRVEAGELAMRGANLNLLFDEEGGHNFSGLLRQRRRDGAPGILVDGPLRLENLALQIRTLGTESVQRVSIERLELDGLAFDRALRLVFEGAIGNPAIFEDVAVNGVLFLPSGTGKFRLADMTLVGRGAGAALPFELSGALDFSARPPLRVELIDGQLVFGDQRLALEGHYAARARPYFRLALSGGSLDAAALTRAVGRPEQASWLDVVAGWTALHDYEFGLDVDRLNLAVMPLTDAQLRISAADGFAQIARARAGFAGGTIEVLGDLLVDSELSLLSAQVRIEIDELAATLAAAGAPLRADGVGQVVIETAPDAEAGALASGSLRFFDGWVEELAELRAALGAPAEAGFEALEGRFVIYPDRVEFPALGVVRSGQELAFEEFFIDATGRLSGNARLLGRAMPSRRAELGGTLARPRYARSDLPSPER
ncbi:MAG: AsmA family protein [Wenzhouxiangella sp.]